MNERHGPLLVLATARRDAAMFPNYFGHTCSVCQKLLQYIE